MTPLNFAIVGLRLIGIYFVVESGPLFAASSLISAFLTQIAPGSGPSLLPTFLISLIPGSITVLLGILLFVYSATLAKRVIPSITDESDKTAFSLEDIQALAFATVGIFMLADALPSLGRILESVYYWLYYQQQKDVTPPRQVSLFYAAGTIAQLIIGLFLLLNPQGFRNIWHWLRTAGTQPKV
jgi:hypothetical protein